MVIKKTIKNIICFIKLEHTVFSLPLVFTGAWFGLDKSFPDFKIIILIVIAAIGARIFGISLNRIFDKEIDALNKRTANRELPSGKLSVINAISIACAGLFLYLSSCFFLGGLCLILFPIPLIPLFFYSFLKRFTVLCHFGIGICLAIAPLSSFVAVSGHIKFTIPVIMFSIFVFCWLSGADIIYAIIDMNSDRINQIHSLPAKFGNIKSQIIAATMHILSFIVLTIIVLLLEGGFLSWVSLFLTLLFLVTIYIPSIPLIIRFFPLSSIAGIIGSITPILASW